MEIQVTQRELEQKATEVDKSKLYTRCVKSNETCTDMYDSNVFTADNALFANN